MRRFALVVVAAGAVGCSFETGGYVADDTAADASAGLPDGEVTPDAGPTCSDDGDCAVPPNACKLAGSCDQVAGVCVFPEVDCSGETDDCNAGVCDPGTGACVKQPAFEGMACGAVTDCGGFSACAFEPGNACDESGIRARDCVDYSCSAGACVGVGRVEEEACARDTDGDSCGSTSCSMFGPCGGFSGPCDESGSRERDCVAYECAGGMCAELPFTDSTACTRGSRDGVHCAPDSCGDYTDCQYSPGNECDEEGVKVRLCTPFVCFDEACVDDDPYSDTEVCTRDTSDVVCDTLCTGSGEDISCEPVHCDDGSCPTG